MDDMGKLEEMGINYLNSETWLICGGRDFADQSMFDEVMTKLTVTWGLPNKVVHGAARGADTNGP
jgi:hypothetical protein